VRKGQLVFFLGRGHDGDGDDLAPEARVRRQYAKIAREMPLWGRHERSKSRK
jgi:hypothetical protein